MARNLFGRPGYEVSARAYAGLLIQESLLS